MNVYWTPEAIDRLKDVETYIAKAPQAANRMVKKVLQRSQQLRILSDSGRAGPEYPDSQIANYASC